MTAPERAAAALGELEILLSELDSQSLLDLRPKLTALDAALVGRLFADRPTVPPPTPSRDLMVGEAAERIQKSASWLYHNWERLHLGFRVGGALRFSEAELDRYLRIQRRKGRR